MSTLAVIGGTVLLSYLIGAVPFGYAVARWRGVDILRQGSGNIGATNVGRVLGRRFGILVFLLDFAKGALPVAAAMRVGAESGVTDSFGADTLPVAAGLAAFLGHLFPVYLRFRGGKGVATGAGVVTVLLPVPAGAALATWVLVVLVSHYVSLASLSAVLALCLFRVVLTPAPFATENRTLTVFCFVAAALVVLRHRANIGRLVHGTENRLGLPTMPLFIKTIHVLALGLWFGSAVFFNLIAAPLLFHKFESLATTQSFERSVLPLPPEMNKEMGTRLAGAAVSPMFPAFFLLEGVCGFIVAVTAWNWCSRDPESKVHRLRVFLAVIALAIVFGSWPLAQKLGVLRFERYNADPQVAALASASFSSLHLYSLLLSLVTVLLVTVLMALAARLPGQQSAVIDKRAAKEPDFANVPS